MRALYGLAGSGLIAILVTLFTKGRRESELEGLVVGTLWKAKEIYKGGKPNEKDGLNVVCHVREDDGVGEVSVSGKTAKLLEANVGDIVYLSDARWWLGGLRSVHAKISDIRDDGETNVLVAPSLVSEGRLLLARNHKIERII